MFPQNCACGHIRLYDIQRALLHNSNRGRDGASEDIESEGLSGLPPMTARPVTLAWVYQYFSYRYTGISNTGIPVVPYEIFPYRYFPHLHSNVRKKQLVLKFQRTGLNISVTCTDFRQSSEISHNSGNLNFPSKFRAKITDVDELSTTCRTIRSNFAK